MVCCQFLAVVIACLAIGGCDYTRIPDKYIGRARDKIEAGDHEAAIAEYTRAVFLNPLDGFTIWLRGNAKMDLALEQLPENIPSLPYSKMDKSLFRSAISDFDQALRLDSSLYFSFLARGMLKGWIGEHEAAISDYDQYIVLKPNEGTAYFWRGKSNLALYRFPAAILDFDQHIRQNSNPLPLAYFQRGLAKASLGQIEGAVKDIEYAISLAPDNAMAHHYLGHVHYTLGNYEEAIHAFDVAISLSPRDSYSLFKRGVSKAELGKHRSALADLKTALELTNEMFDRDYVAKIEEEIEELQELLAP